MRLRRSVAGIVLLVGGAVAEAQTTDAALAAAIAARDKAVMSRDVATVGQYTADDFVAVNPQGVLNTKQERLDGLKRPANPTAKPPQPQRTEAVHMYGSGSAVARIKSTDGRLLGVWIRGPKGWQVHAVHVVPDVFVPQQPALPT